MVTSQAVTTPIEPAKTETPTIKKTVFRTYVGSTVDAR